MDELNELQAIVNDHFGSAESQPKPDETETQEQPRDDDVDDEERDDPPDLRTDERVRDFLRQAEQGDEDDDEGPSDDESIPKEFPCSCSGACGEKFTRDEVIQQIYSLREMEKNEKELYIMGPLNQLGVDKTTNGKRKWTKYQYRFKGSSVCRDFFKAAHDIKDFTLRALIKHMNTNGLVARVHGNTGKKPKHALKFDDVKRVFEFIVSYAEIHGMPQPAAPRGRDDIPPIFLHSSVTKKAVHNLYRQSCEDINELQAIVNDHFGSAESQPKPDETETQEQPRADDVDDEERDDPPDLRTDERVRDFLRQAEQGDEDDDEGPSDDESIPKEFPCSCSGACGEKFTRDEVIQQIYSLREMEKNEKELYIMGALNQLGVDKTTNGKRKWTKYQYRFKGSSVCRDFFKAAHDIKDFTLRALIKHMNTNGLVARVHGNTGKKPKHALKFDDVKRVFEFIVSYAEIHGMPQPAAPRGRDDIPPIFLHSSVTKKAVHNLYRQSCEDINVRVVSLYN